MCECAVEITGNVLITSLVNKRNAIANIKRGPQSNGFYFDSNAVRKVIIIDHILAIHIPAKTGVWALQAIRICIKPGHPTTPFLMDTACGKQAASFLSMTLPVMRT